MGAFSQQMDFALLGVRNRLAGVTNVSPPNPDQVGRAFIGVVDDLERILKDVAAKIDDLDEKLAQR